MLRIEWIVGLTLTAFVWANVPAHADSRSPDGDRMEILASVNGEPVTLEQYLVALGEAHAEAREDGQVVPERDPTELLGHLVDATLVLQEARAIGLDELEEFQIAVRQFREITLRSVLIERAARDLPPPDEAEVDRRYRSRVEEVEVSTVLFEDRTEADAFLAVLAEGSNFEKTAELFAEEQRAIRYDAQGFIKRIELVPAVATAIDNLAPGQISAPIEVGPGFGVIKVFGARVPDDPDARAGAERQVAAANHSTAILRYIEGLRAEYLQVDEALFDSLDFDADPTTFDTFLQDERVVVRIEGGEPIRVSDLAQAIKSRLFHGVERAAERQRIRRIKDNVFEELTTERVVQLEAERLGLDENPRFEAAQSEYEEGILFGLFIQKVIDPSVEVTPDEIEAFYENHVADYTSPEMVRLESLTFDDPATAQRALEHLNSGADINWMRANAEGQVDPESSPVHLRFDARLVTVTSLSESVRKAIAGAETGNFRLYAETAERHQVLYVRQRIAAQPRPVDEVRGEVAQGVFAQERQASMDKWVRQLRDASEIQIFVDAEQLRDLAKAELAGPTGND